MLFFKGRIGLRLAFLVIATFDCGVVLGINIPVVCAVNLGLGLVYLRNQNSYNRSLISVFRDGDLLLAALGVLGRCRHFLHCLAVSNLDTSWYINHFYLVGNAFCAEYNHTLRYAVAHNHAQSGQNHLHGVLSRVALVDGVIHAFFNECVSECDILRVGQSGEVNIFLGILWKLEAGDQLLHFRRDQELHEVAFKLFDSRDEPRYKEDLKKELARIFGVLQRLLFGIITHFGVVFLENPFIGKSPEYCINDVI